MLGQATRVLVISAATVILMAVPAVAGGAGTETFTIHEHEATVIDSVKVNPCTGEPGTLLAVARNLKFHETVQADGNNWVTATGTGAASFVPLEPGGVSYSGHFTLWFGGSNNNKNEVEHETATYVLTGTDGSKLHVHVRSHLGTNAQGEVTVETEVTSISVSCGTFGPILQDALGPTDARPRKPFMSADQYTQFRASLRVMVFSLTGEFA